MPTFLCDVLMPTFLFDIMMPTFLFDVLMPTTFSQERDWKTANCCRLAAKDLGRAENAVCEPARQNKQASGRFQKTDTKTETSVNKDQDKDNDFYRETAVSLVHFFQADYFANQLPGVLDTLHRIEIERSNYLKQVTYFLDFSRNICYKIFLKLPEAGHIFSSQS